MNFVVATDDVAGGHLDLTFAISGKFFQASCQNQESGPRFSPTAVDLVRDGLISHTADINIFLSIPLNAIMLPRGQIGQLWPSAISSCVFFLRLSKVIKN